MERGIIVFLVLILFVHCRTTDRFPFTADHIEESVITTNNTKLYTKVCGQGTPMIFVHGGPGLDHTYFLPQMLGLSSHFQLIFYDQRASGKSSADSELSVEVLVDDIETIRKHYGIDRFHLLGHSWGGFLALKYALKFPEKLHSLILLSSMAPSDSLRTLELAAIDTIEAQFYQEEINEIMASEEFKQHQSSAYEKLFRVIYKKEFYDPDRVNELTLTFPTTFYENSQKLQAMGPELLSYNLIPELEQLKVPGLIVYGVDEPAAELIGPVLWDKIDGSELVVMPRCGHFPFVEQPTRLFEKIISFTKFL